MLGIWVSTGVRARAARVMVVMAWLACNVRSMGDEGDADSGGGLEAESGHN